MYVDGTRLAAHDWYRNGPLFVVHDVGGKDVKDVGWVSAL